MVNRPLKVIILAPTGQDAQLMAGVLAQNNIDSKKVHSIEEFCVYDLDHAGIFLVAEEALTMDNLELLNQRLKRQEPWSDLPIILLTSHASRGRSVLMTRLTEFISSGNVTLLERPFQPLTLVSVTKVAMRSRRRQFLVQALLQQQAEATRMRDDFISIASHELKTPLTSLKLQTQMSRKQVQAKGELPLEKLTRQFEYTINQVERLNKLVDDMLDVSRITNGKLILNKSTVNLSELVLELVERFQPQFEAVNIKTASHIQTGILVECDTYKIEQVLNNLFSNAIRYSPEKSVEVGLKTEDGKALLNVKDNGPGIPPEKLDKIFERFERINNSTSGLGLGLYITRQIIELHDGSIRVESQFGHGANFIIKLPLKST